MEHGQPDAASAGTVRLARRSVPRIGYGAMRLPGPRVWGPPPDPAAALAVVRRAVELGVRVIDTAWYYGPEDALVHVAEQLGSSPTQAALAWLLARSPVVLPIPGTGSVAHLEENVAAAALRLPADALSGGGARESNPPGRDARPHRFGRSLSGVGADGSSGVSAGQAG